MLGQLLQLQRCCVELNIAIFSFIAHYYSVILLLCAIFLCTKFRTKEIRKTRNNLSHSLWQWQITQNSCFCRMTFQQQYIINNQWSLIEELLFASPNANSSTTNELIFSPHTFFSLHFSVACRKTKYRNRSSTGGQIWRIYSQC